MKDKMLIKLFCLSLYAAAAAFIVITVIVGVCFCICLYNSFVCVYILFIWFDTTVVNTHIHTQRQTHVHRLTFIFFYWYKHRKIMYDCCLLITFWIFNVFIWFVFNERSCFISVYFINVWYSFDELIEAYR